jgi:regulatory protein YycH of two-component signal transduction system YycFG
MEKGKTILLNLLILTSFILSSFLLNSQPKYEVLHPSRYVDAQPMGDTREIKQLIKPSSIIFHYGNKRLTGADPDTSSYRMITREMEKWYFFNPVKGNLTQEEWTHLVNEKKGIEILYPDAIPMDTFQELFAFRGKADNLMTSVKRIFVYIDEKENEANALFVNRDGTQMVQAHTAVTAHDLESLTLKLGNALPEQMTVLTKPNHFLPFYIPSKPITMKEYRYFYQPISITQMIQALFVDPSMTREITERDGTMIYTDGSKAVSIPKDQHAIYFHDPMTEAASASVADNNLLRVINFVNEHGGWSGNYTFESIKKVPSQLEETYLFRLYVDSYPIYGQKNSELGSIQVDTDHSNVSGYYRPLIQLDMYFDHKDVQLMSGEELLNVLRQKGIHLTEITDISLGYEAKMDNNHVRLFPRWIIKEEGKDPLLLGK